MKAILSVLALLVPALHADLVVTEVMSRSEHTAPAIDGDWWELTNTGSSAVDLEGYTWDDTPAIPPDPPSISTFPAFTINPGESIIILQADLEDVAAWKATWGLGPSTRVLTRDQFNVGITGGEAFSGLSRDGDEVNLYDAEGTLVANVEFGATISGRSLAFLRDGTPIYGLHSTSGRHGAVNSSQVPGDTASPGDAGIHFSSVPNIYATSSYSYAVQAARPGASAPTLFAAGLPSFLTLTPGSGGTATLESNRPLTLADAGFYLVRITASGGGTSTIQEYLLTVLNPSPTVILNEYNAVDVDQYLNGGTASVDEDGGDLSTDSHFGRVLGNGGPWVEFVVVGQGGPGEVDLRGWSVEIGQNSGSGFVKSNTLVFSNHSAWQSVPTGTVLTLISRDTAHGGLDSGFALRDDRSTNGDTWTNVWMGDPLYMNYTSPAINGYSLFGNVLSGIDIDNRGTQFIVKNAAGEAVFGPAGEGVAPLSGVSDTEVFALQGDPTPAVSPIVEDSGDVDGYDEQASGSSFGQPNRWTAAGTPVTQSFAPYATDQFYQWVTTFSLSGGSGLRSADPDGDGRTNLGEYAFGGDPTVKDAAYPAGPVTAGPQVAWTVIRRGNDPSLTFSYEASEDMVSWLPVTPASTSMESYPDDPEFSRATLQFARPDPAPAKWFLRAKVE